MGSNANKGVVKKPINFEKWMHDALEIIAREKGLTFTALVQELLRQELAVMEISLGTTMGIGREGVNNSTQKIPYPDSEKGKEQEATG